MPRARAGRRARRVSRPRPPSAPIGYGERVADFAVSRPDRTALVFIAPDGRERSLTWAELDAQANRMARLLSWRGVGPESLLAICLPTCPEHVVAAIAAWRLGACTLPLSPRLPERERREILAVAESWRPTIVLVEDHAQRPGDLSVGQFRALTALDSGPLDPTGAPVVAHPGRAICSGGSTGRPTIIIEDRPWQEVPGQGSALHALGLRADQTQLVTGRLHHDHAFGLTHHGLFEGHTVVLLEEFDAAAAVDAIERHRVSFLGMAPSVMQRISRLPDITERDFSSIEALHHSGAPCPAWVKRIWLELVDPARQFGCYGGAGHTGGMGGTGVVAIRGDDWLRHGGSLGKPIATTLRVLDEAGHEVPPGTVGEIFTRPEAGGTTLRHLGAPPPRTTADGLVTLGDRGWVDEEGYLFLADRGSRDDSGVVPRPRRAALATPQDTPHGDPHADRHEAVLALRSPHGGTA